MLKEKKTESINVILTEVLILVWLLFTRETHNNPDVILFYKKNTKLQIT